MRQTPRRAALIALLLLAPVAARAVDTQGPPPDAQPIDPYADPPPNNNTPPDTRQPVDPYADQPLSPPGMTPPTQTPRTPPPNPSGDLRPRDPYSTPTPATTTQPQPQTAPTGPITSPGDPRLGQPKAGKTPTGPITSPNDPRLNAAVSKGADAGKHLDDASRKAKALGEKLKDGNDRDAGSLPDGGAGGQSYISATTIAPGALGGAVGKDRQAIIDKMASEPLAAQKRPDFFSIFPREKFDALMKEFQLKPGDKAFKDVGLSDDKRDFVRTASCNKGLDKGCNPADADSYKAGDLVSPEDLSAIFDALHPKQYGSYLEYFQAQDKARKLPAGDEAYRFRSKKFESKDFDRAVALCLPEQLGGSFDGASHTLDDIDNYARQAVFKCGVQVAEQRLEYADLASKKEKLGAQFRDQKRLDALAKIVAEQDKRAPKDDASAQPLLAPGAASVKGAKPSIPDELRRELTQASLAALAEMPGLSERMRSDAQRWFFNEVGADVLKNRAVVAGAILDALAEKEPALKKLSADLSKKKVDQKAIDKIDAALDDVLKKSPDALPKDDARLKAYADANAAAAKYYQQLLLSKTAEYGSSATARELGADFLAKWVAPLGLDPAKVGRVVVEAVPSLVTGKPVGGWRFYSIDGSSLFVSYGGQLTQAKGARGNSMTTQVDGGKIRKIVDVPAKKAQQKGVWDAHDKPLDVWEYREAGATSTMDGKKVALGKGSTHILNGSVVFYDQEWTQANGLKRHEYYNNEKYSSEAYGKKARAHKIEDYQANGDRVVTRMDLAADGSEGEPRRYLITAAGKAVASVPPFSDELKDDSVGLGSFVYASEDKMLEGAVPEQLVVSLRQLSYSFVDREAMADYLAGTVVKTMHWSDDKKGPLKTAFLFRTATEARRALDERAMKQVGVGGEFFVKGDKMGFSSECGGHCGRLYEDFNEITEAGMSLPDLSGAEGQEVEPVEFKSGVIDKSLSLVTYRPLVFSGGKAVDQQPPDAGNIKTAEYSAGHTTEWLVKVDKSDASTLHSGKLKFTYYVKVHDGGSAYWKNAGRYGDPVTITTEKNLLSQSLSQIGDLPVLKQVGQVTGHVAGWAYHDVIQSNVQGGIGAVIGNDTYKLCAIANSVKGHGDSHEEALTKIESDPDLNRKFTQASIDSCMEDIKNTRIRPELMRADAYAAQGPEHCRTQAQSHEARLKYLDFYCGAGHVISEGGTVGAVLGGLDMAGEVGANLVVTVPGIGGATTLLGKAEAFGKALAVGELATGDAIAFGRATQVISAAGGLYLHGGMMTQFATGAVDTVVSLADASDRTERISAGVNLVGDIVGMKLGAKKRGLDKGEVPAPELEGLEKTAAHETKAPDVTPPPDIQPPPEPGPEQVTSVGKKPTAPVRTEAPSAPADVKPSLLSRVGDKLKSFFGGDKTDAPAVETAPSDAGPKAELLSKKDALKRFNGVDPLDEKQAPRAPGNDIRGQGGWNARKIIINGEEWVLKKKTARDATELERNKQVAQNVILSAELARLGSKGVFDVPETLAYTDGDTTVTLMRFEEGAHKDAYGHKLMTGDERAELSVLALVFGMEDRNYGNQLIPDARRNATEGGRERPVLIDFDSMERKPRGQMDPALAKNAYYSHGYAPWVDGGQYNDPKVYQEAEARWKKKLDDPAFQKQLRGALDRAGFDKKAADAYLDAVQKNLADYEHNVGLFLDLANKGHEPPPSSVIEMTAGEPTNAASPKAKAEPEDSRGESTNAASPKAKTVVPLAERKAFTADALVKYHELVISIDSGEAEGRGKVALYGRAENLGPKGQKIAAEFKKAGFDVEFTVKGERELPAAPRPDDVYKPEQKPDAVHYPRRVDSFEKNAVINDDQRTFEATSGTMNDAHGSIILREPYKGTKDQKTLIKRFNKLGYEVSFSGNESIEGAKVVSGADGRDYWSYKNGELFKDSQLIKDAEQRGALLAAPPTTLEGSPDPKIRALAARAEKVQDAIAEADGKKIAAESHEGQQSCSEGNCVARAAVNVRRQGDAQLYEVFAAAEMHGVDANDGMHASQTRSVLGDLNAQRAANKQPGRYVSKPFGEFIAEQNAAIARGEEPPAGLVVIRRGDGTTHAVVDRGPLAVDGERYRILTDSTKSAPVPYDAQAYGHAAISDYVIVFDEKSKAAVPADPALETTKAEKPAQPPARTGADPKSHLPTLGSTDYWHGWQDRLGHLFAGAREFIHPTDAKALDRKLAETQKFKREDFEKNFIIKPNRMDTLPKGIPEKFRPGFEAIRDLTGDKTKFFEHMQALEREIAARSREKNISVDDAREQILGEWEARHGFKPVIDLNPGANGSLPEKDFLKVLKDGALFRDKFFNDKEQVPGSHGEESHRLQWNAVMREMEAHPDKFGGVTKASELYKELGNLDRPSLDWRGTVFEQDPSDLWFRLFDSTPGESNWASPEFTRNRKDYWPGLGHWE